MFVFSMGICFKKQGPEKRVGEGSGIISSLKKSLDIFFSIRRKTESLQNFCKLGRNIRSKEFPLLLSVKHFCAICVSQPQICSGLFSYGLKQFILVVWSSRCSPSLEHSLISQNLK